MRGTPPTPVAIRGERYPSIAAAARALRVTPKTIRNALERGTQDRIGIAKHCPHCGRHTQENRA